jgi:hypothetical protein
MAETSTDRLRALAETKEKLKADKDLRDRWIGVYIGALAVLLALCVMGGGNATKDANRLNIEAANLWSFFQAKNLRRNEVRNTVAQMELALLAAPAMPEPARQAYRDKISELKALDARLTSDPEKREGLDELWTRAKALEKTRDDAFRRDPYFDWSQAMLQIAIVLASVCLITANLSLLGFSGVLAVLGTLMMFNGFTMLVNLPFM